MAKVAQSDIFLGDAADSRGEFAATPSWVIQPAFVRLRWTSVRLDPDTMRPTPIIRRVLDAGAGLGALGIAVEEYALAIPEYRPEIVAVERETDRCVLLPRHWEIHEADFTLWGANTARVPGWRFDLVICNPPFSEWLQWAKICLSLVTDRGSLIMVGPLEYLGGVERGGWLAESEAAFVHIHCKRPRGQGWDDTRAIATVTWDKSRRGPCELIWVR